MAVPSPRTAAARSHGANPVVAAIDTIAPAWMSIPATMRRFRPMRSDSAPVAIWVTPQVAG